MTPAVQAAHSGDPGGQRFGAMLAAIPFVLLAVAYGLALAAGDVVRAGTVPTVTALAALALAYRLWWQLARVPHWVRTVGFVLNIVLTFTLLWFSPFFGVYAFVGYLDAVALFTGVAQTLGLIAAASLNALAHTGGPQHVVGQPVVFAFLLLANGGLAVAMVHLDNRRQRTVSRLTRALAELEDAHRVNDALQGELLDQARAAGGLAERQRLSREIHDTVAQDLIALLRQIEAAVDATTLADARTLLERADSTARGALVEARRAVNSLASPLLDQTPLHVALAQLPAGWSDSSGIEAEFELVGHPEPSPHDADLLRVCQEALANVAKHSRAARVVVTLDYSGRRIVLRISDDGIGFSEPSSPHARGIAGMRARLRNVGGDLSIDTGKEGGCVVTAAVDR